MRTHRVKNQFWRRSEGVSAASQDGSTMHTSNLTKKLQCHFATPPLTVYNWATLFGNIAGFRLISRIVLSKSCWVCFCRTTFSTFGPAQWKRFLFEQLNSNFDKTCWMCCLPHNILNFCIRRKRTLSCLNSQTQNFILHPQQLVTSRNTVNPFKRKTFQTFDCN